MRLGDPGSLLDLGGRGVDLAKANVIAHAAVEKQHVLRDHANLAAQALQAYATGTRLVKQLLGHKQQNT